MIPAPKKRQGQGLVVVVAGGRERPGALTMLRRHEAGEEREDADAASVASSRMAGQSRSKTRWLRYTDPGCGRRGRWSGEEEEEEAEATSTPGPPPAAESLPASRNMSVPAA
jgi:hypothetical protein